GRKTASTARSSASASAATSEAAVSSDTASRPRQRLEGRAQDFGHADVAAVGDRRGHRVDRRLGLAGRPSKPDERVAYLIAPRAASRAPRRHRSGPAAGRSADLVLELEHDALGSLATDAGDGAERREIFDGDRATDLVGAV